jgi:hypothetical protein
MIFSGEKASDVTKKARKIIEDRTNVRGRKLDLMLESEGVVLCSCERKSMASSKAVVVKQYVKNLRVNSCILYELCETLDDNNTEILAMYFKGTNHQFSKP